MSNQFKTYFQLGLLAILLLTISIIHASANESLFTYSTTQPPSVPTLGDLGVNGNPFDKTPTPLQDEEINAFISDLHSNLSSVTINNLNSPSPTSFKPIGHFENTLMPDFDNFAVNGRNNLYLFNSSRPRKSHYSQNAGLTWISSGIENANTIVVSPTDDNHIMLGSSRGITHSFDGGKTWNELTSLINGILQGGVVQIIFSPTYATDNLIFARKSPNTVNNKFVVSSDGGITWSAIPINTNIRGSIALASNYQSSQKMLATAFGSGVLFSGNGGVHWVHRNKGLDLEFGNWVNEVMFSPNYATDNLIFARTSYGIYQSKSDGQGWHRIIPFVTKSIKFHPNYSSNKTVFMIATVQSNGEEFDALFRSYDGGKTFEGLVAYVRDFQLSPDYLNNQTMYALTDDGMVESTDNGQTWYLRSRMSSPDYVTDIVISPSFNRDHTVFLVRKSWNDPNPYITLWRSTTLGFTWDALSLPIIEIRDPFKIGLSPDYERDQTIILLLGTASNEAGKLYQSVDGGDSWSLLNNNLPLSAVRDADLRLSPNYVQDNTIFISDYEDGLFRSENNGQTWTQLNDSSAITSFAVAPHYPVDKRLFISHYNNGISRSDDGGLTWNSAIEPGGLALMLDLSPNFEQDNTIFATNSRSSGGGVWMSTDAGDNWTLASDHPLTYYQNDSSISPNFSQDQMLGVYVQNSGYFLTEDAGNSWYPLTGGDLSSGERVMLTYLDQRPFPIAASTDGFFIYTWPSVSSGFSCPQNLDLNSAEPQYASISIGADSPDLGQWQIETNDITWLSLSETSGSFSETPELLIDSNGLTESIEEEVAVNIYLSHHYSVSVDVPLFIPCTSVNLPIMAHD